MSRKIYEKQNTLLLEIYSENKPSVDYAQGRGVK
jgi:hypothetical protein